MSYRIIYDKPAVKFLKRQPKETQKRIISAIHNLPDAGDIKPLAEFEKQASLLRCNDRGSS